MSDVEKTDFTSSSDHASATEKQDDSVDTIPVVYHYLKFETELPSPSQLSPPTSAHSIQAPDTIRSAPKPPNLIPYTSPFLWPESRKSLTTFLACIATMCTAYTAGSYASGAASMSAEWSVSQTAIYVGITMFTTGFAVAPMVLAPFSEINGRKPVFVVTGALFVICQLCCAVTRSYVGMLVSRFLVGVGGSTFSTMVGGVVSDIYHAKERNTPMAIFAGGALFGTGLGPLVSGFVAQRYGWRWIFWVQVLMDLVVMVAVLLLFKETRGSVLLSRKAKRLNQWYEEREKVGMWGFEMPLDDGERSGEKSFESGFRRTERQRIRWKVKSDEERETLAKMIGISLYRPFHLLITEPVVFFFSLWVSFSWAVLYLTFSSIPLVFTTTYGFDVEQNGSVFAAMCVASVLATFLSVYQEKLTNRYSLLPASLAARPEGRLLFSCIVSSLLPIGLFWFGWTCLPSASSSSKHQHPWIVPTLSIGCATIGIFAIYLAVFNYLADTYHRYASSALAAQSFCRNILGGIFPLVADPMFRQMGFAGASSFLGGVGVLLTLVPWVLVWRGERIRGASKIARELVIDGGTVN
ncbi:hypothetical protein MMC25_006285 [Agyrium rufum]|nr:hypothetical protein [Agyrium rufum]